MFKGNMLVDSMNGRLNNFDFIRLMAAILVIFSHSFPLSMGYIHGTIDPDPLFRLNGNVSTGRIAVMVFFIISGFLITKSYERLSNPIKYMKSRSLRIFPGLLFSLFFTALLLGPIVTTLPITEYFAKTLTFRNVSSLFWRATASLPGVFQNNAFKTSVNGSLWSVLIEFKCYILVLILGMSKLLKKPIIIVLSLVACGIAIKHGGFDANYASYFCFTIGMLIYMFRDKIVLNTYISVISLTIALTCLIEYKPLLLPVIVICIAYTVMSFAFNPAIKLNQCAKYGDFSYGIYVFAFPIQQTITFYHGGSMVWWQNILISLPLILIMAIISWHLVEKNALKLNKTRLFKKRTLKQLEA